MAASITTLDAILKEFYLGPIEEQLNNETMVIDLFEKATVDWQGKNVIIPIHLSRNSGVGFKAEGTTFAGAGIAAGNQGYARMVVTAKFLYGRFELSGPAIASAKTGANSFATYIEAEINKLTTDVRNESNFTAITGGAVIGLCWSKGNGVTKQYSGQSTGLNALGGATDTCRLRLVRTGELFGAQRVIAAVTETAVEFTVAINTSIGQVDAAGNAVVAGDVFAVELDATSTVKDAAGANEVTGIWGNLFAGEHFGIARNTNTELISTCFTVSKGDVYAALNLDSIQNVLDEMLLRADEEPTIMVMNPVMRVEYTALLQGVGAANLYKDLTGAQNGDAGFTSMGYAGIPMKVTRHAPKGSIMFLCPKYWRLLELDKKGFADLDGSILSRVAGAGATDAYEGFYKWYYEVVCHRPNANAVLTAVQF
jgi:hypothetical protein